MDDTPHESRQKLREMIDDMRFAMFTTAGPGGALHSRPMTVQKDPQAPRDATHLWFFMSRDSEPVTELTRSPMANVSLSDTDKDTYVSISGRAQIIEDMAIKVRLWSKMNEAWFPRGVEDPDLALVRVEIEEAEYWNVAESKLMQIFKIAKAALSNGRPDLGEHVTVAP